MIDRMFRTLFALAAILLIAATGPLQVTGQLLAYQDGYVFFTTGDGFRVAPNVTILDETTHKPFDRAPLPRDYARAVFDTAGTVVEIDIAHKPYPVLPLSDDVQAFAVTASTPYPNPELGPQTSSEMVSANGVVQTFSGKPVLVTITVQVPPDTPPAAQIFISTDQSSWNPQAIQMDRIDALHYRIVRRIDSGTILHYVYTRGSLQTEERGENNLDVKPRQVIIGDADARAINDVVYNWADFIPGNNQVIQPGVVPTPYNPAPFPNLPSGIRTPAPR
jgi:hypothetical protein